jgi:hypothetical protein
MKCVVFESEKMENIPIAECGGIQLKKNQKLIVKETIGDQLTRNYPKRIVRTGSCEMGALRNGHYQIVGDIVEVKQGPIKESPLKAVSSDRSMEGVGKEKVKRKTVSKE